MDKGRLLIEQINLELASLLERRATAMSQSKEVRPRQHSERQPPSSAHPHPHFFAGRFVSGGLYSLVAALVIIGFETNLAGRAGRGWAGRGRVGAVFVRKERVDSTPRPNFPSKGYNREERGGGWGVNTLPGSVITAAVAATGVEK